MPFSNIDKPNKYFNTVLWTGNNSSPRNIDAGHATDFVWVKFRTSAFSHRLFDIVRGASKKLISNTTDAEDTGATNDVTAFISNGFTIGSNINNSSDGGLVGWSWVANGAGVSNTQGSITSTVSANTTSGFSIVSYTGDSSGNSGTVGHGLGVTPAMIIVRNRTNARNWGVWHKNLTATSNYSLALNLTDAQANDSSKFATAPTSTVFTPGYNDGHNENGSNHIAYCFAEVKGYSKFGSYTGNGSTDGTFVYTGFKPAMVILKRTDSAENWDILDSKRNTFNVSDKLLKPNLSNAEATFSTIDMISNGFKQRNSDAEFNASGGTYIYMAFAENPFVSSKGIPCTAR